ncbi:rhodopsin, GQ-coupled-like [Clavelina lepadiformis]|uniref:rhodopsin, GQ-coupled-like n=1 Tax=Clavelina lepadiformis TaxID=159417 RepID=UPI00404136A2
MCSSVLPFVVHSSVNRGWKLGVHGCKVDGFLGGFFAFLQLNTLCEIAIQRYLGVKSLNANAKRRAGLYRLALVWAISALIAALPLFGFGRFMLEGIGVSCTFNYIEKDTVNLLFVVSINVVEFFVPCTIIICSYVGTMKVCETSRCDLEQISMVERHRIIFKRRERRLAKICVISVACFVVSWAPYSTMSLLMVFTNVHVPHLFASLAACIAKMSTAVNGTIYVVNHQDFQKSLRRYIPRFSGVIQDSNNFTSIERRPSSRCRGKTAVTSLQR